MKLEDFFDRDRIEADYVADHRNGVCVPHFCHLCIETEKEREIS